MDNETLCGTALGRRRRRLHFPPRPARTHRGTVWCARAGSPSRKTNAEAVRGMMIIHRDGAHGARRCEGFDLARLLARAAPFKQGEIGPDLLPACLPLKPERRRKTTEDRRSRLRRS